MLSLSVPRRLRTVLGIGVLAVAVTGCVPGYMVGHAFDAQHNWLSVAMSCGTRLGNTKDVCDGAGDGMLGGQHFVARTLTGGATGCGIGGSFPVCLEGGTVNTSGRGFLGTQPVGFDFYGDDNVSGTDEMDITVYGRNVPTTDYVFHCNNCFELTERVQ